VRDDLAVELFVAVVTMSVAAPLVQPEIVGVALGVVSFVLLLRWTVVVYEPEVTDA